MDKYVLLKCCLCGSCASCRLTHHSASLTFLFVDTTQKINDIPLTESLKDTVERTSVYWDEVLAPALQQGKTLLIVGHENNLRSLLMRLEDIDPHDVLHLNLPRAVP